MTDDEKVYSVDEVNHLISEMDKVIAKLKTENAVLRERLENSVENGKCFISEETRNGKIFYSILRYKVVKNYICTELTRKAAETRLAEMKGEER